MAKSDPKLSAAIGKLEGNITKAFQAAQTAGDKSVTVKGNAALGIGDKSINGNDLALRMRRSAHNVEPIKVENSSAKTYSPERISFFNDTLGASDAMQQEIAIHETMHETPALIQWNRFNDEHQVPFNDAARKILNGN